MFITSDQHLIFYKFKTKGLCPSQPDQNDPWKSKSVTKVTHFCNFHQYTFVLNNEFSIFVLVNNTCL